MRCAAPPASPTRSAPYRGLSFEDYVRAGIVAPLGMPASSFCQPVPPVLAARLATGYRSSLEPVRSSGTSPSPPAPGSVGLARWAAGAMCLASLPDRHAINFVCGSDRQGRTPESTDPSLPRQRRPRARCPADTSGSGISGHRSLRPVAATRPLHLCPVDLRKLQHSTGFKPATPYRRLLDLGRMVSFDEGSAWLGKRPR
jgi:hypothetical protein